MLAVARGYAVLSLSLSFCAYIYLHLSGTSLILRIVTFRAICFVDFKKNSLAY